MKKNEIQDEIIRVLMNEDGIGFSLLCKKTEESLRNLKNEKYALHDDVFNDALSELLGKSVYKTNSKNNGRPIYRLAPQRKEADLDEISKFVDGVSKNLKTINNKESAEVLSYIAEVVKNFSQLHKILLMRKHFADKDSPEKISSLLDKIDEVIGEAVTIVKKRNAKKLADLQTSVNYTINQEYLGSSYTCVLPYSSSSNDC